MDYPPPPRQLRGAFTLIEALIVVALLATLAGLLLPSLSGAREVGRCAVCASNARQLMLADDLYASDARGRYAPGARNFLSNLDRWHGARSHPADPFHPRGGSLTPYLDDSDSDQASADRGVRACPSFVSTLRLLDDAHAGFERSCGGYGYNNAYIGVVRRRGQGEAWIMVSDLTGSPASLFSSPAGTIGFADAAFAGDPDNGNPAGGLVEYSFTEPRAWPDAPGSRADPSIHFRHNSGRSGRANTAWLDGHVSPESLHDSWSSGLYASDPAEFNIGWFGRSQGNDDFDYR